MYNNKSILPLNTSRRGSSAPLLPMSPALQKRKILAEQNSWYNKLTNWSLSPSTVTKYVTIVSLVVCTSFLTFSVLSIYSPLRHQSADAEPAVDVVEVVPEKPVDPFAARLDKLKAAVFRRPCDPYNQIGFVNEDTGLWTPMNTRSLIVPPASYTDSLKDSSASSDDSTKDSSSAAVAATTNTVKKSNAPLPTWSSYDFPPICPSFLSTHPTNSLQFLKNEQGPLPSYLNHKFTLFIGDSQDRNSMQSICANAGGTYTRVHPSGRWNDIPTEYAHLGGDSRLCVIRDTASSSIHVLVSLFNIGVTQPESNVLGFSHHLEDWEPNQLNKRISEILPNVLRGVVADFFPEWCLKDGVQCPESKGRLSRYLKQEHPKDWEHILLVPADPPNPLVESMSQLPQAPPTWIPKPDLVIAHSSLWDILVLRQMYEGYHTSTANMFSNPAYLQSWWDNIQLQMLQPLSTLFETAETDLQKVEGRQEPLPPSNASSDFKKWGVGRRVERPVVMLRTCPLTLQNFQANLVARMNNMVRTFAPGLSHLNVRGVIDWDKAVEGMHHWLEPDGFHQNHASRLVYGQMVLTEYEMMEWEERSGFGLGFAAEK
ncbi:hypothetical protein HDV05_001463 [Chytridiales sp. JEL 0842]|nr:hypothetical protein HDV05_001463 [Chytridiales sp. JEL 0842]